MALNENPTLQEIVDEVERLNNLIVNRGGSQTITPGTSNKTLNKGYYKGNITIKGDTNLVASNIIKGKSIFGVSGSATVSSLGGKKWASGTATTFYHGSKGYHIQVNGLGFKPRTIIVHGNGNVMYSEGIVLDSGLNAGGNSVFHIGNSIYVVPTHLNANSPTISTGSTGTYPYKEAYIYNNGFFLSYGSGVYTYRWIAFE